MGSAFSKLQAFRFATLLSKPFKDWDAFALGVIDEKGNLLKKPATSQEKKSMDAFENLIRKVKKILVKYIPDTRLFQFLVATYLLKTESRDEKFAEMIDALTEKERDMLYSLIEKSNHLAK